MPWSQGRIRLAGAHAGRPLLELPHRSLRIVRPTVFIVSEGLQAPPTTGFHIHLLSIAHALAAHVNVRMLAWTPTRGTPEWDRWAATLPGHVDPESYVRAIAPGPREGSALGRKIRCWRRAQQLIAAEARPGDVLWVRELPTALFAVPFLTRWLPGRRGMRYVYDVASIVELEMGLASDVRLPGPKIVVERWLRPRFDRVRTLGDAMAEFLAARGVDRDRLLVTPVGAYAPTEPRTPRAALRRLLYIGSDEAWQGLPVLLTAMRELHARGSALRLSVVGVPAERLAELDPPDNVDALGWVARDRISALYHEHDLFVIPRPSTPLTDTVIPMKSVEALVHHIPILASDLRAIEEVTGRAAAVLVRPGSSEAIVESLQALEREPERLVAMSSAAAERASDFEWSVVGRRLAAALFPDHVAVEEPPATSS